MKNNKNETGITLMALIITIIILLILASIGITSGMATIRSAKFTGFVTELKVMQIQANEYSEKFRKGDTLTINGVNYVGSGDPDKGIQGIQDMGEELTNHEDVLQNAEVETIIYKDATTQEEKEEIKKGFRYLSKDYISNSLKIDGITRDFLINVKHRMIVSVQGFSYEGVTYYTIDQIPEGFYNVGYKEGKGTVTFTLTSQSSHDTTGRITVSNIQYEGYVTNWEYKWRLKGQENWNTSTTNTFKVDQLGMYEVMVVHGPNIQSMIQEVGVGYAEQPESNGQTFSRSVGTVDLIFLSGTGYQTGVANRPVVDESTMIPIKYKDGNWVITSTSDPDWYNYNTQEITRANGTKTEARKWANVMLGDGAYNPSIKNYTTDGTTIVEEKDLGSMFVWIPRYAYKIAYFTTEQDKQAYVTDRTDTSKIIGYSDARGIVDVNGKVPSNITENQLTSIKVEDNFRTHPVFEENVDQGGWGKKTTGFWMAKFETTNETTTKGTNRIIPNKGSQRNINLATMFQKAQAIGTTLDMNMDSHVSKNSERGATAYLAESLYGRNGTEITINNSLNFITGNGGTSISASAVTGVANSYDTIAGQLASTTGNIYGIYDMSGGAYEYPMAFYEDEEGKIYIGFSGNATTNSGFNGYYQNGIKKTDGIDLPEKKYYQTYTTYNSNLLGDALYEVENWNEDDIDFVSKENPIFQRGGSYQDQQKAGIFHFNNDEYNSWGHPRSTSSFRVCLTQK